MAKFVCSVCSYVHEGDSAPEKCPVCGVPAVISIFLFPSLKQTMILCNKI